jgi:predicted nucleotidyltransferase
MLCSLQNIGAQFMITNEQIEQVKERLIKIYDPLAIYIFGSYAWGHPTEDSDLDLLVVVDRYKEDRYQDLVSGHKSLIDMDISKDILLYNKEQFEECSVDKTSICNKVITAGKKIFLFSIILTISLHATEQPNSPLNPSSRATQANDISLGCAFMIPGFVTLAIGGSGILTDSLNKKKLHASTFNLVLSAIGTALVGIGDRLHNREALLKNRAPALFNNKENGVMLASLGLATSLLTVGPALKNTHHLGIEHLALIAGIIGIGVGVKVYNTDASPE